ncbi:hypothetical protein PG985_000676 [Apiospora marii]|uniref:F-box domain-containing protein n=1 Tax=Apiospora marii TaxID=335849 RepID=A0ABR1R2Z4_9PEZI
MAAPFLALPTELATTIVTHLDVSDLLRLSKTCRNLHAFAQPFLLDTVTLAYNPTALPNQSQPLASLLRLLVRRDGPAPLLRHLKLVSRHKDEAVAGPLFFDRDRWWNENRLLFEAILEDLQMPDREDWRRALQDGETKALVALVLAYCAELESLEASPEILFATAPGGSDNWILRMFRHLLGVHSQPATSTNLRKLRHINIPTEQ